jgi:hypothetical protein
MALSVAIVGVLRWLADGIVGVPPGATVTGFALVGGWSFVVAHNLQVIARDTPRRGSSRRGDLRLEATPPLTRVVLLAA